VGDRARFGTYPNDERVASTTNALPYMSSNPIRVRQKKVSFLFALVALFLNHFSDRANR
jgi:hypothetical protein